MPVSIMSTVWGEIPQSRSGDAASEGWAEHQQEVDWAYAMQAQTLEQYLPYKDNEIDQIVCTNEIEFYVMRSLGWPRLFKARPA